MDSWQKEHIRSKLPELLVNTSCTIQLLAILLSENVLSKNDVDEIEKTSSQQGKSMKLYDILMTRVNGYPTLVRALNKCFQSGSVKLLVDGYYTHFIDTPNVNFQGRIGHFWDHFSKLDKKDLLEILVNLPLNEECIDLVCGGSKSLALCHETIPPFPKFYIERSISNRLQLQPEIFKEKCNDVFVFMGIEKGKLRKLVKPELVLSSRQQLVQVRSRFILLEEEWHWLEMRKISGPPIHLIQYEAESSSEDVNSESYILEETIGNSEVLLKFSKSPDKKAYITEDELLAQTEMEKSGKGICICDTPGMGKTWTIASLARKVLQRHPGSLVGFIALSELSKQLQPKDPKPTLAMAINLLLDELATSSFAKSVLLRAVKNKCISLEIFFDGLDEVSNDCLEVTTNLLKALMSEKSHIKIYVTSRPHVRRELESSLGVIAYNFLPFTEQNQLNFLVEFWKYEIQTYEETKLEEFAKLRLRSLEKEVSKDERDIMGIPLQCFLLANIHENEARLYSDPKYKMDAPLIKSTSIYDMYKQFINEKFKSFEISPPSTSRMPHLTEFELFIPNSIKRYHLRSALLVLFPRMSEFWDPRLGKNEELPMSLHFSFGILEQVHKGDKSVSRFVHRTFAEFLVAEFIGDMLVGEEPHLSELIRIFYYCLKQVFGVSHHYRPIFSEPVIVSFIDKHLACAPRGDSLFSNQFESVMNIEVLREVLPCCAEYCFLHLLRLLKDALLTLPSEKLLIYRPHVLCKDEIIHGISDNLNISVKYAQSSELLKYSAKHPVELIKECFQLLEDCFGYTDELAAVLDNPPNTHIPLQEALEKRNYEVVEYLADKFPLKGHNLLFQCIDESYRDSEDELANRIELLEYLLSENKSLIYESSLENYSRSNFFQPRVHVDIIKYLLLEGKNILLDYEQWLKWLSKIVENLAVGISLEDFINLIFGFLYKEIEAHYTENNSLDNKLLMKKMVKTFVENITDQGGNSLFLNAVQNNKPLQFLNILRLLGANLHHKNEHGESALHVAARKGNKLIIGYLQGCGLSLEERDRDGSTPLLNAGYSLKLIRYFVENGVDPLATNENGETIAHWAASWLHSADEFHKFIVLLTEKWDATETLSKFTKHDTSDHHGGSPLHMRLYYLEIHMETLLFLLDRIPSENLNKVNSKGYTCLHSAVANINHPIPILEELVRRGIDYNLKTKKGENVLDIAIKKERPKETIEYFQTLGMKPTKVEEVTSE